LSRDDPPINCWLSLFGTVYDVTGFIKSYPGGAYIVQKLAGKDGATNYQLFHPQSKLKMIEGSAVCDWNAKQPFHRRYNGQQRAGTARKQVEHNHSFHGPRVKADMTLQ
jgi:hypothetical protein